MPRFNNKFSSNKISGTSCKHFLKKSFKVKCQFNKNLGLMVSSKLCFHQLGKQTFELTTIQVLIQMVCQIVILNSRVFQRGYLTSMLNKPIWRINNKCIQMNKIRSTDSIQINSTTLTKIRCQRKEQSQRDRPVCLLLP